MRHFTVTGRNRLPRSTLWSWDRHSAWPWPSHSTFLPVASLSCVASSLLSNLPLSLGLRNAPGEWMFSIAKDSLCLESLLLSPLDTEFLTQCLPREGWKESLTIPDSDFLGLIHRFTPLYCLWRLSAIRFFSTGWTKPSQSSMPPSLLSLSIS